MLNISGLVKKRKVSHSKVAEALGVPLSTVRSLVTRARQKMQPMLVSYGREFLPALEDVLKERDEEVRDAPYH